MAARDRYSAFIKPKCARGAHLQIGTTGGAANGLREGSGGRAIDDMDRKGERDADRDGEPGQHKAHREGAELARDQPAPGGGTRGRSRRKSLRAVSISIEYRWGAADGSEVAAMPRRCCPGARGSSWFRAAPP